MHLIFRGGNDPAIVLPDVDIGKVASQIATFSFLNSGQICIAIKRIYVHEDIYPEFRDAVVAFAKTLAVGDGRRENVFMGPVQNKMQYERVKEITKDSKATGQNFLLGGELLSKGEGYFISPTIVDRPPDASERLRTGTFHSKIPCPQEVSIRTCLSVL